MMTALPVVALILGCVVLTVGVFVMAGLGLALVVAGVCLIAAGMFVDVPE